MTLMTNLIVFILFTTCVFLGKSEFTFIIYNGPTTLTVISNGQLESYFDYNGQNTFSCQVPDVFHEKSNAFENTIEIKNNDQQMSYNINLTSITTNKNVANPTFPNTNFPMNVLPGQTSTLIIEYNCVDLQNSDLFYTNVDLAFEVLETSEVLEFSYIKICKDRDYIEYKFDYSLVIVVIIVAVFVLISLRVCKIMSLKKKPTTVHVNFLRTFLYFIALIPLILLFNFVTNAFLIVYKVLISIVAFFAFVFFANQFLGNLFIRSNLYRVGFTFPKTNFEITLFMIIGAFLGFAFIIPWGITNDWVLSDIITLILFITAINILKVNKFKNALFLMFIQIAADILWMILFNYLFNRNFSHSQQYRDDKQYNDFFGSKLTLPLKIECAFLNPEYNLNCKCSWISISNLIIPCLFISYFNRYDTYVNATIYSVVSIVGYLVGLIIWIAVQSKITKIIPLSVYIYTLMCLFCGILAFKRNEHYEIWNGLFPDMGKEDPLIKSQDLMEQSNEKKKSETEKNEIKIFEGSPIPEGKSVSLSVKHEIIS